MKLIIKNIYFLALVLILSSCKCYDCEFEYLTYQIENKLDSPIQVSFISNSYPEDNILTTINKNEIKDVIYGETGLRGFGLISYDSAFLPVNSIEYRYQRRPDTGLLSSYSYVKLGSSKKDGKILYTYRLTIDEEFLMKPNK